MTTPTITEPTKLDSTQEYAPDSQFLSGSLSHFVFSDNRSGSDAPDMTSSAYLKGIVAGIQLIGSLVIIGEVGASGNNNELRFAVENTGRPAADFEESIASATGLPVRDDAAVPPVAGIRVVDFRY